MKRFFYRNELLIAFDYQIKMGQKGTFQISEYEIMKSVDNFEAFFSWFELFETFAGFGALLL
jgi:hypothetical protein